MSHYGSKGHGRKKRVRCQHLVKMFDVQDAKMVCVKCGKRCDP